MEAIKWSNPHRKRNIHASYNSQDYVQGYDIDLNDFTKLVLKLTNEERLNANENDRYRHLYSINHRMCIRRS